MEPTIDTSSVAEELQQTIAEIANTDPKALLAQFGDALAAWWPKLLTAAILLIVGILLVRWTRSIFRKLLSKSRLDPTLHQFILSIFSAVFYIVLGISVLSVLVPSAVGSLIALFGVFGLAISLAVKDSLGNLAGGMSVLFTKPFAIEDYVQINKTEGTIEEIRLNYTVLRTFDNKVIHIPNGDVAKAEIVNYSSKPSRRLDLVVPIPYEEDFERAQTVIRGAVEDNPLSLHDPAPIIRVIAYGDSAVKIGCRVWVATGDYWTLNFDLLEEIKRRFDANGISIPYNRMDVHLSGHAQHAAD